MRRTLLILSTLLSFEQLACSDDVTTDADQTTEVGIESDSGAISTASSSAQPEDTSSRPRSTDAGDAGTGLADDASDTQWSTLADGSTVDTAVLDGSAAGSAANGTMSGAGLDASPGEEDAGVCVWTTVELLDQVNTAGTYALDCGAVGYAEGTELVVDGIECVLAAEGDAGAKFVNNECPDCLYQRTYLHLSNGEFVLIFHSTQLGEPDRRVSVERCATFDTTGACLEAETLYECEDKAGSGYDWSVQ